MFDGFGAAGSLSSSRKVSLTFPFSCIQRITLKVSKSEIFINFSSMKNDKLELFKNSWLVFWTLLRSFFKIFSIFYLLPEQMAIRICQRFHFEKKWFTVTRLFSIECHINPRFFPFFKVLSQFHKSSSLTCKMALKNWVSCPLSLVLSIISVDKKLWMASRALHVLWLVEVAAPFSAATTEIQKTTTLTRNENDRHRSEISNDGNSCKKLELWIFSHYLAFMLR